MYIKSKIYSAMLHRFEQQYYSHHEYCQFIFLIKPLDKLFRLSFRDSIYLVYISIVDTVVAIWGDAGVRIRMTPYGTVYPPFLFLE